MDDPLLVYILVAGFFGLLFAIVPLPLVLLTRKSKHWSIFRDIGLWLGGIDFLLFLGLTLILTGLTFAIASGLSFLLLLGIYMTKPPDVGPAGELSKTLKWFLITVLVLTIISIIFILLRYEIKANSESTANLASPTPSKTLNASPSASTNDWQTYTNRDIGYSLKYPKDWTVKETDEISQLDGKRIKFITLYSADQKYSLIFGIKRASDDSFRNFERSGVGGDLILIPEKTITALGLSIVPEKEVINGKTKEFFYRISDEQETQCNCKLDAFYGMHDLSFEEDNALDLPITLIDFPNKIVQSVQWL